MSVLPIVTYDDDVLRKETKPVQQNSPKLQRFIDDLFETMYNSDGVGLAAPQVGELLRIFVADADPMIEGGGDEEGYGPVAMINPKIIFQSDEKVNIEEGCLSIPGIKAPVSRSSNIVVQYIDRNFDEQELEMGGWLGRVIQHEADHLDGVLFLDHLSMFKRTMLRSKLSEIADGSKEIEYPTVPKKVKAKQEKG